jgi:hypothetical protein
MRTMNVRMNLGKGVATVANGVPVWAVVGLGLEVQLTQDLDEYGCGSFVYRAGQIGILDSIEMGQEGAVALVVFLDDVTQAPVEVPFPILEPYRVNVFELVQPGE